MSVSHRGLRAAVIGMGGMGRRHLESLARLSIEPAAVCDLDATALESADALCAKPPRRYVDWRALLAEERGIDFVTIATNGPSHCEIAVTAARAGIRHILCEKPMATSGADARTMARVCSETGTRLAVNMSRRYAQRFVGLKTMLQSGAIGALTHINVSVGAGGLGCIGTHYFDFVSWLADTRAAWVVGEVDKNTAPNVRGAAFHDPGGRGMVGYANGMTTSFQLSGSVAITPLMQIVGTDGYVDFDNWSPPARGRIAIYARPAAQRSLPKTRFVEPERVPFDAGKPIDVVDATAACIDDLIGAQREDTVAGGIEAVDTVMAFHLSSQRGLARIALPLAGGDLDFDVPIT